MALNEVPPAPAFGSWEALKTFRPDKARTIRTHVVKSRTEDLRSVAQANGVDVAQLIKFNFPGSVDEKGAVLYGVVNWYLHHHKEFHCPDTLNRQNRRFRGGETIYIPDLRQDPYRRLVDRTRERWTKAVEALRRLLKEKLAGEAGALASPNRSPTLVRFWQEEVARTRGQLEEAESHLRELAEAEKKEGNPEKVWKEISGSPSYHDDMIRRTRDDIKRLEQLRTAAEQGKTRNPGESKFWEELIEGYRADLKTRQDDLKWLIQNQKDAQRIK